MVIRPPSAPASPSRRGAAGVTRTGPAGAVRRYARHGAREVVVDDLDVTFFSERTNTMTTTYGDPDTLKEAIADLPAGQRRAVEVPERRGMALKEEAAGSGTSGGAVQIGTPRGVD